ncbi:hypothetical protein LIER_40801 [Lithospermum erythrorhizon]|uniref:Uncharacterized protein n=1 Tax=Lithospermum erythrorhizon TaxID=34254 RepID=A0AAV3R2W4_LITER
MDRKWMQADRSSEEYKNGVKEFICFATRDAHDKRKHGETRTECIVDDVKLNHGLNNTSKMDIGDEDEDIHDMFEGDLRDHPDMHENL